MATLSGLVTTLDDNYRKNVALPAAKLEYRQLLNVGGLFFVLQIGTMIGWSADALIVSTLAGVTAVTQFAIVQRMYSLVSIPLSIMNAPLWGAYADANAPGLKAFDNYKKTPA